MHHDNLPNPIFQNAVRKLDAPQAVLVDGISPIGAEWWGPLYVRDMD